MPVDESYRKPGAVPFKWEIRPGVPKLHDPLPSLDNYQFEFKLRNHHHKRLSATVSPSPETPSRLKPPPAGLSIRSPSNRVGQARPDVVSSAGCFPSPVVKLRALKTGGSGSGSDPGYYSDLENGSSRRWSFSGRKSVPVSPVCHSYRWPGGDADWAGFGLF
ncbi:uncharacterized protein LOC127257021 [Andrographis paniculata]|uniref:uncharacterized protein LOC127257021 n=1 Tax=Andrographis paniculata TaxID=175694 RepID=UPI0021E8CF25|nr:uncharacterized protein LOC127257021 [Andrographis paniculata]